MKLADYNPQEGRYDLTLHTVIRTQANLSHIGETVGNQANLRLTKAIAPDGKSSDAFEYSGNALRNGLLRQYGARSFFEAIGVSVPPKIHQTFFSGGAIDGGTGNDLAFDAKLRQLCPILSLLGTAKPAGVFGVKDALMIGGRSASGPGILVCWETMLDVARLFPAALPYSVEADAIALAQLHDQLAKERAIAHVQKRPADTAAIAASIEELLRDRGAYLRKELRPYRQWLVSVMEYPRDSTQQPDLKKYMKAVDTPLLAGEGKKQPKKTNADGSKDTRNVLEDWLLCRGATLYSRWSFRCTKLEEGAIADALLSFADRPYLGGKNRTGNGLVDMQVYWESPADEERGGEWMSLTGGAQQISDRAAESHARYREYLGDYRDYLQDAAASSELRSLLEAS